MVGSDTICRAFAEELFFHIGYLRAQKMEVSVVVPVFNAIQYIEAAVNSILAVPEVAEVVIVDDGSTDGSRELVHRLFASEERVVVYHHPGSVNKGVSATRNLGMQKARKEFIAFLDSDDLFLPDRFKVDRQVFAEHADAEGVYGAIGVHYHDEGGREQFNKVFASELTTLRKRLPPERLFEAFMGVGEPVHNLGNFSLDAVTLKRSALAKMPQLLREGMSMHEDSEFTVRLAFYLRMYPGSIEKAVALRGVHGENRITANERSPRMRWHYNEVLLEWAMKEVKDQRVINKLRSQVVHGALKSAGSPIEKRNAIKLMLHTPSQWKRVDSAHAFIELVTGKGTWTTRTLKNASNVVYRILWKIKGSAPPVPIPSVSTL